MLRKVYTANVVSNGNVVGSMVARVWFWWSPYDAWDMLLNAAKNNQASICDFRRVK